MRARLLWLGLTLPAVLILIWILVLAGEASGNSILANALPWPVACTTKGCVTTKTWETYYQAQATFAEASQKPVPTPAQALTTLLRQRLVEQAQLGAPVTAQDAQRYREEILNAKDNAQVREATGLTLVNYDEYVILPLLRQEVLRAQRRVESLDELYRLLAEERFVAVLAFGLKWDKETAQVIEN